MAFSLSDVRNLVLRKARLLDDSNHIVNDAVTTALVNDLILEAMWEVTKRTGMPEVYASATWPVATPAVQEINLPNDVYRLLRVYVNGKEIFPSAIYELNQEPDLEYNAEWQVYSADSATALAVGDFRAESALNAVDFTYYLRRQQPKRLGLVPAYNVAHKILVDYVQVPVLPATDAANFNYPDDFRTWIVNESLHRLFTVLQKDQRSMVVKQEAFQDRTESMESIRSAQAQFLNQIHPYPYMGHFEL